MPLTISSLTVSPTTVIGGAGLVTLTITMSGPAPVGGIEIALSGSPTGLLNLPKAIYVAGGQTTGTVSFTTNPIAWQWVNPNGVLAGIGANYVDPVFNISNASCTLTVQSYGPTSGPGMPTASAGFTPIVNAAYPPGYPIGPPTSGSAVNTLVYSNGTGTGSGPANPPNSNLVLGQNGTQQAMAKLNILNIGTNPPPKDGR
jgi:hypothetical protein